MAFYSQKSLGCGGVPPKKPGKEIKERNVEDRETAGFLEILQSTKMYLGGNNITTKVMYLLRVMRLYQKYHIYFFIIKYFLY